MNSLVSIEPVQRVEGGQTGEVLADEGFLLGVDPGVHLDTGEQLHSG